MQSTLAMTGLILVNFVFSGAWSHCGARSGPSDNPTNLAGIFVPTNIEIFEVKHQLSAGIIRVHHPEVFLSDYLFRKTCTPIGCIVGWNYDALILKSFRPMEWLEHIATFWSLMAEQANLAAICHTNCWSLTKIREVKIPRNFFSELHSWNLFLNSPHVWSLASDIGFTSIIKLFPEKSKRTYGKYGEDYSAASYPPIWSTHPYRPSPFVGWFLFGIASLIVAIGFWCTFIFARYQFYMQRVLWGVTCLLLGIFSMLLGAMLMFHSLSLTLHPVPWQ